MFKKKVFLVLNFALLILFKNESSKSMDFISKQDLLERAVGGGAGVPVRPQNDELVTSVLVAILPTHFLLDCSAFEIY